MIVATFTTKKLICYSLLSAAVLSANAAAAPFKWVDQTGQVHYSQVPPVHQKSHEIDVATYRPKSDHTNTEKTVSDEKSEDKSPSLKEEKQEKQRLAQIAQHRKESCIDAKHNLMVLENNSHVREKVNGEFVVLSQAQREKRIARLGKQIQELCQ